MNIVIMQCNGHWQINWRCKRKFCEGMRGLLLYLGYSSMSILLIFNSYHATVSLQTSYVEKHAVQRLASAVRTPEAPAGKQ